MNNATGFFMVFGEGCGAPSKKHPTFEAAKTEAERLSRRERRAFYVLQAVGGFQPAIPPVEWSSFDYDPAPEATIG